MSQSPYEVLHLSRSAPAYVIQASYRRLMKEYHPDRHGSDEHQDRVKEINDAYSILSNPVLRAQYDATLTDPQTPPAAGRREDPTDAVHGEIVVGPGRASALTDALARAPVAARIQVLPGVYAESLLIERDVDLVGRGSVADVVIESTGTCVTMRAERARIQGITLRSVEDGSEEGEGHALDVSGGILIAESCELTSGTLAAVKVAGPGARLELANCTIRDAWGGGLSFYDGGDGLVELSEIVRNGGTPGYPSVYVDIGASVTLRGCLVADGQGNGIYANGHATLENCELRGAGETGGLASGADARLRLQRCLVEGFDYAASAIDAGVLEASSCRLGNGDCGVHLAVGCTGLIDHCDIYAMTVSGVSMMKSTVLTIRDCVVQAGVKWGVYCDGGAGTLERCELQGFFGLWVQGRGGHLQLSDCRAEGVQCAAMVTDDGILEARGSRFGNGRCAVCFDGAGGGRLDDCDVFGATEVGLLIDSSAPTIRRCVVRDGAQWGITVFRGAGVVEGCDIFRNAVGGVELGAGANTAIMGCNIRHNAFGVWAHDGAGGSVRDSNLTGNLDKSIATRGAATTLGGNRVLALQAPALRDGRGDAYLPGLEHEQIYDNIYFTDLLTLQGLLGEFVEQYMRGWSKVGEELSPDGLRFVVSYEHRVSQRWEVRPVTPLGRMKRGHDVFHGNAGRPLATIPYELSCTFMLTWEGTHSVTLAMHARESIDPHGSVEEYPLGGAFLAPSYLWSEGCFGAQLDPFLSGRLSA